MNVIMTNYGDDSVALMQWAIEAKLPNLYIVSVDTGWSASGWDQRIAEVNAILAKQPDITIIRLQSNLSFAELMRDRGEFPTPKFQWCAGILKGLPILDWLDTLDPRCEATVLLSTRREQSASMASLPERIEESEHYGDRAVWHPLVAETVSVRDALLQRFGVAVLGHRALECDPCVNSSLADFQRLKTADVSKAEKLETELGQHMFVDSEGGEQSIADITKKARKEPACGTCSRFDMGCGSPYVCGQ